MIISFLNKTASYIKEHFSTNTQQLLVVLPNRRGALFLKRHLSQVYQQTIWLPKIISVEEFIADLSCLKNADSINMSVLLYESYLEIMQSKADSFDQFIKWSDMMLQDFNEIDRYLVNATELYKNLSNIKEIEHWSLGREDKSALQLNYLEFMSSVGDIYQLFQEKLIQKGIAYQGLAYRKAVENLANTKIYDNYSAVVFAGFNALNKSEELIFDYFKKNKNSHFLCDGDEFYVNNEQHEAGNFLRKYIKSNLFNQKTFIENNFKEKEKKIEIIGSSLNMAQVASAAELIKKWIYAGVDLSNTAVVLCDEGLLFPLLHVLPEEITELNVSLEYPLFKSTLFDLVLQLCNLHINKKQSRTTDLIYYKDILKVIQNPYFAQLLNESKSIYKVKKKITEKNTSYFTKKQLEELFEEEYLAISFLFTDWNNPLFAIQQLQLLGNKLLTIYNQDEKKSTSLETEFIIEFIKLTNQLQNSIEQVSYITELKTLRKIIQQLQRNASVPFYGEPLKGLQIMGVLETRTLDFENVILISVNESILPSGKSNSSFLPYDLKRYFNLPVFQDKDAVYAYHFYRILQRAKNIGLIFNTESDAMGKGEKSRFITQLINELPAYNQHVKINHNIAESADKIERTNRTISIPKTEEHLSYIQLKAANTVKSGFSASLFNTFRDCSLRFYFNYVTRIKEQNSVEENIETNTMGTILHEVLESCYQPFVNKTVSKEALIEQNKKIDEYTNQAFKKRFTASDFEFGKNYLAFKTVQLYATRLLTKDADYIDYLSFKNDYLEIISLEKELNYCLNINFDGKPYEVKITGICDRIDRSNYNFRIVDYKSSSGENDTFLFEDMASMFNGNKHGKMFQLFIYAWLCWKNKLCKTVDIFPCIIPFRSAKGELLYIHKKENKQEIRLIFTDELLLEFEVHLIKLIEEIFNPAIQFNQTENLDNCKFCTYSILCKR
jgi:hypothetical protein